MSNISSSSPASDDCLSFDFRADLSDIDDDFKSEEGSLDGHEVTPVTPEASNHQAPGSFFTPVEESKMDDYFHAHEITSLPGDADKEEKGISSSQNSSSDELDQLCKDDLISVDGDHSIQETAPVVSGRISEETTSAISGRTSQASSFAPSQRSESALPSNVSTASIATTNSSESQKGKKRDFDSSSAGDRIIISRASQSSFSSYSAYEHQEEIEKQAIDDFVEAQKTMSPAEANKEAGKKAAQRVLEACAVPRATQISKAIIEEAKRAIYYALRAESSMLKPRMSSAETTANQREIINGLKKEYAQK